MIETIRRAGAAQACMTLFAGQPMDWKARRHCGRLAAQAMMRMGHSAKLLNACRATTLRGVLAYLKRNKFASLVDLMDATGLERIAPAMARPGDIVALPSQPGDGFGCSLTVALSDGRVLMANELTGRFEPVTPHVFVAAWRV
jgi:hypothetical protein